MLTYRCRQIVKKIMDAKRPLRIKELSEEFQVSIRAIKYDLETIRSWIQKLDNTSIRLESKPNRGIWLEGDYAAINQLLTAFYQEQLVVFSQDERVKLAIIELLTADDYITISSLEQKIGVSRNTVVSDLQQVDDFLKSRNIHLERKSYRGLRAKADELYQRLVLEYILQSFLTGKDMSVLLQSLLQVTEVPPRVTQIAAQFSLQPQDVECICQAIRLLVQQARESIGNSLSERAVLGLFIRFCIVIQRVRTNHPLLAGQTKRLTFEQHIYYLQIQQQCNALANCLAISISESEINYILPQWLAVFGQIVAADSAGQQGPLDMIAITGRLIQGVSVLANVPFHKDPDLFSSLLAHLTDRIAKYSCNTLEPNPLVAEIIRTYGTMFHYVKQVCVDVLSAVNIFLNDADTAYLVLHFQAAFERKFGSPKFTALVVCGTGRGNARLLKTQLENEFKNLHVIGCCSVWELEGILEKNKVDLVVSVLPVELNHPTVVINAIPTKQDFSAVQQVLNSIRTPHSDDVPQALLANNNFLASLAFMKSSLNTNDLPAIEALSQEIINRGFQLATLIINEFKTHLTEQAAAGLTIHILLMVNRLAFNSPYLELAFDGQAEKKNTQALQQRLTQLLQEQYPGIPASEINSILHYFS